MFKRILVPLDGSIRAERALPIAAQIARATGATIVLWHVVSIPVGYGPYLAESWAFRQRVTESELEAGEYLTGVTKSDTLAGIATETEVLHGAPALALLSAISERHIDLVVICSHGRAGVKRWIMGSVAQKIAYHSAVPVLILHENGAHPSGAYANVPHTFGVVVALDGSERSLASIEPAAQLAAALAAPAKGAVHLIQVVPLPLEGESGNEDSFDRAIQEQVLYGIKKYMSRVADDLREGLAKDLDILVNWSIIIDTDVANSLIAVAGKGEVSEGIRRGDGYDLLAMTTHGQGGRLHGVMGTVTDRVLSAAQLPLLIVRPRQTKVRPEGAEFELVGVEPYPSK